MITDDLIRTIIVKIIRPTIRNHSRRCRTKRKTNNSKPPPERTAVFTLSIEDEYGLFFIKIPVCAGAWGFRRALAFHRKKKKQEVGEKRKQEKESEKEAAMGGGDVKHRSYAAPLSFRKSEGIEAVWLERGEGGERCVASVGFFTRL